MPVRTFGDTDVGLQRTENEDSILIDEELSLFVVADGMGGHKAGEVASAMAVQTIRREIEGRLEKIRGSLEKGTVEARNAARSEVAQVIALSSKEVYSRAKADDSLAGMGTTVALVLVVGEEAIVAHAGDSRVYLLRGGQCNQLTEDHTMLQEHLKHGLITPEEAKAAKYGNVISRAVGIHPSVKADTLNVELEPGDHFVICSDGLHGYLDDGDLKTLIGDADMSEAVRRLIEFAKDKGGKDNISVIDIRVTAPAPPPVTATATASSAPAVAPSAPPAATASDKIKAIQSIPLFRQLDYKEVMTILTIISVRAYAPGDDVITEGEVGDELFVVLTGCVDIKKGGRTLATLGKMKHFGEMALLDNEPRSATVMAAESSKLMVITREDFHSLIKREPSIGVKLLTTFCLSLSERLRATSAQVSAKPSGSS